jgi:hypothetical protein
MSTGLARIQASKARAAASASTRPQAITASPRARLMVVSSVTCPRRSFSQPPPRMRACTPKVARISRGVMNSTVAPRASPTASPR